MLFMPGTHAAEPSSPAVHIRIAGSGDMSGMIAMINAAFVVENFIEGTRTDRQRMSTLMQKGEFLVAQDDNANILGSVHVEIAEERGYLGMLAVDPNRQGTGLGRKLVQAAENHCRDRGCTYMKLTVLSQRLPVLSFYRKLGYKEAGKKEFRPSRPLRAGVECHAIVMTKQL
jgi:ribosomal protein S18 acetylase RimI-like enzyme